MNEPMYGDEMTAHQNSISISVVIPAFNAGHHIERALKSVLGQTSPAEEIIVCVGVIVIIWIDGREGEALLVDREQDLGVGIVVIVPIGDRKIETICDIARTGSHPGVLQCDVHPGAGQVVRCREVGIERGLEPVAVHSDLWDLGKIIIILAVGCIQIRYVRLHQWVALISCFIRWKPNSN